MKIWQKAMAGVLLLGGFAGYTHYQKSAEPAWKVNTKDFSVVKSLEEGSSQESVQYPPVILADYFGVLQNGLEAIQLPGELRTLKIEKYWYVDTSLYLLYSVNLKETDKTERDVPELTVEKIAYTLKDGSEKVHSGSTLNEELSSNEYVYKHRLYRSIVLSPQFRNVDEGQYWGEISQSSKVKLDGLKMVSNKTERSLEPISLKVSPFDYQQVLGSSPLDQKITFPGSRNLKADKLDFTLYNPILRLKGEPDKKLAGFVGKSTYNYMPQGEIFEVNESDDKGLSIPLNSHEMVSGFSDPKQTQTLTFNRIFYRTEDSLTWKVNAAEIAVFNKRKETITKEQYIGSKSGISVYNQGFYYDNEGQKLITFSLSHKDEEYDVSSFPVMPAYLAHQSESGDPVLHPNSEIILKNAISIKNEKGESLKNFEIQWMGNSTCGILFHNNQIPEEDLIITLSHIVGTEKLAEEINIQLKFPSRK